MGIRVASMFAGIGGICLGFKQASCEIVWANDVDKAAAKTYRHNFGDKYFVEGDIRKIQANSIPDFDILTAGFPCQSFSVAGKQRGFDDARGNLFFEVTKILDAKRPQAVFLENVSNLVEHDEGRTFLVIYNTLVQFGYFIKYRVMSGDQFANIPQKRSRIFIVAFQDYESCQMFSFPEEIPLDAKFCDFVDLTKKQSESCYYDEGSKFFSMLSRKVVNKNRMYRISDRGYVRESETCPTLVASMCDFFERVPVIHDDYSIRRLTPTECLLLQGFPGEFTFAQEVTEKQAYKQAGNTVCVPLVKRIAEQIVKVLENKKMVGEGNMKIETFFDFCSGIGGGRLGLEKIGLRCVGRSETSRLADITYKLMHGETEKNHGNLKRITAEKAPCFDLMIAGFPCQTFSVIGRREGFDDDRGQIIFHLIRLMKEFNPKCFILENVRGLVSHDKGKTLLKIIAAIEDAGFDVAYKVLSSINFGVPQMRQRVYFVGVNKQTGIDITNFSWPSEVEKPQLCNYLIDNDNCIAPDNLIKLEYYLKNPTNNDKFKYNEFLCEEYLVIDTRMSDLRLYRDKVPTLRSQRDGVYYVREGEIRQLTGFEALLLQGFPKEKASAVKNVVTDRHLLMQAGNAMTVPVITQIGKSLIDLFDAEGD